MSAPFCEKPDNFIIYIISARSPEILAKSAVDLAVTLKNETLGVIISNTIFRADKRDIREKSLIVNKELLEMCKERYFCEFLNSKRIKQEHLNKVRYI